MKDLLTVTGPPTATGSWANHGICDEGTLRDVEVGDLVNVNPWGDPPIFGIVGHVQRHDDRTVATVEASTLQLPAGWEDDWRAVIAPEEAAEWVEAFLEDEAEGGRAP